MARELLYLFQSFCCFNSISSLSVLCDSTLLGHLQNDFRARNNLLSADHKTHIYHTYWTLWVPLSSATHPPLTAILRRSKLVWAFRIETSHTDAQLLLLNHRRLHDCSVLLIWLCVVVLGHAIVSVCVYISSLFGFRLSSMCRIWGKSSWVTVQFNLSLLLVFSWC